MRIDCVGVLLHVNLVGYFVSSPREGRKDIDEIVEEIKERYREERGTGMKEKKQKEIETFPSHFTCYKESKPCPTVNQYQLDALVT